MKRTIPIVALTLALSTVGCSANNTETNTTSTETATEVTEIVTQPSGTLDADSNPVKVTIDESTGWKGEFATGAVYLYGPAVDITKPNVQATAIVETVEKDVYEDHVANANSRSGTKEFDNGLIFNGDDGYTYFITDLGGAYILINAPEGTDIETVLNTITFETP